MFSCPQNHHIWGLFFSEEADYNKDYLREKVTNRTKIKPLGGLMDEGKMTAKLTRYEAISELTDIINFKGATLIKGQDGFYRPMTSDAFARIAYDKYPGILKQQISELEHKFRATAPDHTDRAHLIGMGEAVWDTKKLAFVQEGFNTCVFATQYSAKGDREGALKYVTELAAGNEELAWDILQGLAPLLMSRKPAGVIWFIGGGANGKSALVNAMYKIFGQHFSSITVSAIEDGRDAPRLNGVLGNVCRESSEGRVEDSERYKAIGTHEPFEVHKFHSQDMITVTGDVHHVFNANNIPVFSDKTEGARRRTLIIPFNNHFKDDPTFEDRVFTPQFLSGLLELVLEATQIIKGNRFKYRFSETTAIAKADYDSEVNSAEAFFDHMKEQKVEAFSNYNMLMQAYQSWCSNEGVVPLGVTNLKRAMKTLGDVQRRSVKKADGAVVKWYFFGQAKTPPAELTSIDNGLHIGLKTADKPAAPEQKTLGDNW